jgi:hypothetical protein
MQLLASFIRHPASTKKAKSRHHQCPSLLPGPPQDRQADSAFPPKDSSVRTQLWCAAFLLPFLHRVRRLASTIGAIRRISRHDFQKLKMWPVTTRYVLGAVTRAISQAPLFHAHSGYEADHYRRHPQMPENTEGIFYTNNNAPLKLPEFHPVPIIRPEGCNKVISR